MTPPLPPDEAARIQALISYAVLDTEADPDLDDLAQLAAEACEVPIALISLVDTNRQWFKARVGIPICETSRETSFCAYAILGTEPMVIPDATADPRFADNPIVTGDAHIRFYAGIPLRTPEGYALGTLSVLDIQPRALTLRQLSTLERLGRQASRLLDLGLSLRRAKEAEEALVQSERLLRTAVAGAPIILFSLDREGICTFSEGQGLALVGLSPGEVVGKSMFELYRDFPEILAHYHRALAGEAFQIQVSLGIHVFETRYSPIRDPQGDVIGIIGISVDVTERDLVRRNLEWAKDQAVASVQAKSQFLANMSHEIRTPMNGVLGMTDLLLRLPLDERARRYAQTVKNSAASLLVILNDILDFSKIEAGMMTIAEEDCNLSVLIAEVRDLLNAQAHDKGLQLLCQVAPEVPRFLRTDPSRLRQILINLVGNALKFTTAGSVRIIASALKDKSLQATIRVSVQDTGIGIPEERQAAIFESFTQVDGSTSRQYGGTGLGLTICRQLAELMGGQIGLESRMGVGSTFWVDMPCVALRNLHENRALGFQELDLQEATSEVHPLIGLGVLLADDNVVNQEVALSFLEDWGCRAARAGNGQEVLDLLEQDHYDVILMDVQMPQMNGLEATQRIRTCEVGTGRRQPIIALTASALEAERESCLVAGMDDYLSKPIDPDALLSALSKWIPGPCRLNPKTPPPNPKTPPPNPKTPSRAAPSCQPPAAGEITWQGRKEAGYKGEE